MIDSALATPSTTPFRRHSQWSEANGLLSCHSYSTQNRDILRFFCRWSLAGVFAWASIAKLVPHLGQPRHSF